MDDKFYFLGWDVGEVQHHEVLLDMLNNYNEFDLLEDRLALKRSGLFLIVYIQNSLNIFKGFYKLSDLHDFVEKLTDVNMYLEIKIKNENLNAAENKNLPEGMYIVKYLVSL